MVSEPKMREILFRGKRKDNGEWVEGHLIVYPKTKRTKIMVWEWADLEFNAIEVRPETVGQFTGLSDKNGKRIFDGDILSEDYVGEDYMTGEENSHQRDLFCVVWEDGGFKYYEAWERLSDHKKRLFGVCDNSFCCQNECGKREVIGNIHDNPELLEVRHG